MRIWVPQCSTGQDAYSVAISLLETMGRRWREASFRVICTVADPDELARARAGRFSHAALRGAPRETLERFFTREAGRFRLRPFVLQACQFVVHDPIRPPPFSRVDVVAGRDVLSAMAPLARAGALRSFHSVLGPDGILLDVSGRAAEAPRLFLSEGKDGRYTPAPASTGVRAPEHAGARLRESEDRLRILSTQSDDAILVRDTETDFILEANEAAQRLFGRRLEKMLALRFSDLGAAPRSVRRSRGERRSEDRLRLPHFRRKDGAIFPADTTTSFIRLDGRPCELWVVRDAIARLRGAHARRRADAQVDFLGDVVHELRSPLSVIKMSAATLRSGAGGSREKDELLGFIENHTVRMGRLVDRLLELSSADAKKLGAHRVPVPLAALVWTTVSTFVPLAKRRGITIGVDIPPDLAAVADPADLPPVFGNLLDNSLKYTPKGGRVAISARADGREAVVSVQDSGPGIPPEDLTHVFERFFRSARTLKTKGTGLGLAIVQSIVKANGGRIAASNGPGGGALFRVTLNLAPSARAPRKRPLP